MKLSGFLLLCLLLTACQSIESRIENLPTIDYDPVLVGNTSSFVDDKVSFQVASAGTEAWVVVKNGTHNFLEISSLNLTGTRCTYTSRGKIFIPPGSVKTYQIPTLGLLGLCFTNEDQSHFINQTFNGISYQKQSSEYLNLFFIISYSTPGVQSVKPVTISQTLYLNFNDSENSQ